MQHDQTKEEELDRGFWLTAEAQVGELRRLYALESGEGEANPELTPSR